MSLVLETPRLLLRPFAPGDRDFFLSMHCDGVLGHFMRGGSKPEAEALLDFAWYLDSWDSLGLGMFVVLDRASGTAIGECGLWFRNDGPDGWATRFIFIDGWRGAGLGGEALDAILEDAFERAGLKEVHAVTHDDNPGSQKLLESRGYQLVERRFKDRDGVWLYVLKAKDRV